MKQKEFLKLNIRELERRTQINRGTLSKYFSLENPETPTWKNILKISTALNMSAEETMEAIDAKRKQKEKELKVSVALEKLKSYQTV